MLPPFNYIKICVTSINANILRHKYANLYILKNTYTCYVNSTVSNDLAKWSSQKAVKAAKF